MIVKIKNVATKLLYIQLSGYKKRARIRMKKIIKAIYNSIIKSHDAQLMMLLSFAAYKFTNSPWSFLLVGLIIKQVIWCGVYYWVSINYLNKKGLERFSCWHYGVCSYFGSRCALKEYIKRGT